MAEMFASGLCSVTLSALGGRQCNVRPSGWGAGSRSWLTGGKRAADYGMEIHSLPLFSRDKDLPSVKAPQGTPTSHLTSFPPTQCEVKKTKPNGNTSPYTSEVMGEAWLTSRSLHKTQRSKKGLLGKTAVSRTVVSQKPNICFDLRPSSNPTR